MDILRRFSCYFELEEGDHRVDQEQNEHQGHTKLSIVLESLFIQATFILHTFKSGDQVITDLVHDAFALLQFDYLFVTHP